MAKIIELNPPQKEAVTHKNGPLLVLAGAGAGKTRVITSRIFHLIKGGVAPSKILALTFTNKASDEMRSRVLDRLKSESLLSTLEEEPFIGTFHSLGVKILRDCYQEAGIPKHFVIFDRNDSIRAMKEAIKKADFDPKQFNPGKILSYISKMKGDFVTRENFTESVGNEYFARVVSRVWEEYQKILNDEKGLDFSDLLLRPTVLLSKNENLLKKYQNAWDYIHIDEYQDTNKVQYKLSKMLAENNNNIFVVGDIDQNIYSWRGASIENIFDFEKDFGGPKVILLEENYRSTKTILETANKIIEKNKNRKEKKLFTKKSWGEKISTFGALDEKEESLFVAEKAKRIIESGVSPNEIAVLYRANFQSRILEESFIDKEVPYKVLGVRFFERKEVKDCLSYLRASLNPDSLGDIKRIINVPRRGIGKITILKVFGGKKAELSPAMRKRVDEFFNILERIKEKALSSKPSETIKFIISESGLQKSLREGDEDDAERLENIKELVNLGTKYDLLEPEEGVAKLLEEAALQSEQDSLRNKEEKEAVRLMTVHASKGLEFDYCFITGLEDGLFPHETLSDDGNKDEEEERRLFYVALTRARKKLFLTLASSRKIFGESRVNLPSEFFGDIDDSLLEDEIFEAPETIKYD